MLWGRHLFFIGCLLHVHSIQADDRKFVKIIILSLYDGKIDLNVPAIINTKLSYFNPVDKAKSPGVDPKQLAAELQKVSLQQSPLVASSGVEKGSHIHSGTTSATSSAVPSPGQPGSPSVSKKRHSSKVRNFSVVWQ